MLSHDLGKNTLKPGKNTLNKFSISRFKTTVLWIKKLLFFKNLGCKMFTRVSLELNVPKFWHYRSSMTLREPPSSNLPPIYLFNHHYLYNLIDFGRVQEIKKKFKLYQEVFLVTSQRCPTKPSY